jgi:YidC/Oxa1 family membrane protein insertase
MDTRRLILLVVFGFSVLMLWDAWLKQSHPVAATTPAATTAVPAGAGAVPAPSASAVPSAVPTPGSVAGAAAVPGAGQVAVPAAAEKVTIKTDLYTAEISTQGGDLVRLALNDYAASDDESKRFVLFDDGEHHIYEAQSGLIGPGLPNHKTLYQLVAGPREMKAGQETLEVRLEASGGEGVRASKVFTFHRGSYLIDVSHEVANGGAAPIAASAYFQFERDGKPAEETSRMGASTFTGPAVYTEEAKFQKVSFEDIAKGKAKFAGKGDNGWLAMVQHYFVAAILPQGKTEREYFMRKLGDDVYAAGVILPMATIAPGSTVKIDVPIYAGPQIQDKLAKIAPGLNLVVDYGWLTVIAAPIFWVLELLHSWVGNWGWAIILLTVMIKLAFFPLSAASYKSMAKMRVMSPKLQKLKETYGDDKQRLNQEMMDLYKREKINPLGGCLPILVQIPVFISLYWVLLGTVEMRGAPWLGWITDLSVKDPYYVLPLIMGATMLFQTKLNPTPPDPIQAKVMLFMPIVFTGMFLFFPAGLVLYWTVNNLLSIGQQWQITRMIEGGKK